MKNAMRSGRRSYPMALGFSVLALVFAGVAQFVPRIGYPAGFAFTMFGILALIGPAWEAREGRVRLAAVTLGALISQIAIVVVGMSTATSVGT